MHVRVWDIIIVGGGPAGLTAGIYAARAKMNTLLIESTFSPSLITTTDSVENYPGFPEGIGGFELVERFKQQALGCGLKIVQGDVATIRKADGQGHHAWVVAAQEDYPAHALIIATGANYAKLNVLGEKEFTGRGVSYCATCDAPFYKDKEVVVVGGGDTAVQEALFLTKFATHVTLVHRRNVLRATGILKERAFANERLRFVWNAVVDEILGDKTVKAVRLKDVMSGATREIRADGIFIFTGIIPNTDLAADVVERDAEGYIIVDENMQTSAPGIFSCGDCNRKLLRQVVTACGDGATAAFAAERYVEELKGIAYPPREKKKV